MAKMFGVEGNISTHVSARRRTPNPMKYIGTLVNFNSRLRKETNLVLNTSSNLCIISIHVSARRRTLAHAYWLYKANISIHVSTRRRTPESILHVNFFTISIHVSARRRTIVNHHADYRGILQLTSP